MPRRNITQSKGIGRKERSVMEDRAAMESFSEEVTLEKNGQAMLVSEGNALWVEGTASAQAPRVLGMS